MLIMHIYPILRDEVMCIICETASVMASLLAPEVRSQFAQRLKNLRTQKGFDRARYFARSLGIEENRYTRYERAEVEPNLTLIHKMCEILRVSPNELLGFSDFGHSRALASPGLAEMTSAGPGRLQDGDGTEPSGWDVHPVSSLAWNLASETVAIRHEHGGRSRTVDPLATLRETGALFSGLQSEPFQTVSAILNDPSLRDADARARARIAELIQAFTATLSEQRPERLER
jgi:transcriptional regulator with XRE-family HTH domain